MSLEHFQLIDNEAIDGSYIKREVFKIYLQHAAISIDSDQNIEFRFVEKFKFHQIDNSPLQNEMTIEKGVAVAASKVLVDEDAIRLLNNAFACCFREGRLSTAGGSNIEYNKIVDKYQLL